MRHYQTSSICSCLVLVVLIFECYMRLDFPFFSFFARSNIILEGIDFYVKEDPLNL